MENAIVSGFQVGTKIMMAPFEYFANRFQERIKDELSDIQAAGGLLAVARRQQEPFVKDFAESMRFTQQMNKRFAEIAAALPGSTQEYVEVGKRLGDTAGRIVANDVGKAIKEANVLRTARGEAAITGTGRKSQQTAIQEILGELTTKTVLAGLGSGGAGGAGRNLGPYGLPGLTERLIGQEQVSMGQFQRYSAIFRDPAIMQALDRYIPLINSAQKDSIERFQILKRMYDEILPPEVIRAYERSFAGLMEIYNTAFFNPEKGIFGLGRKMQGLGPAMDDMGRYIKILEDGTVKVVESVKEASKADLSVFDMFRDITANIGLVLGPIVNNLTVLFDPMKKIGNLLVQARIESGRFLFAFESYRKGLADMVKNMPKDRMEKFSKIPVDLRASLAAINNLFRKFGVINMKDFEANAKKIMSDEFDVAAMMKGFFDTFLNSKIAKNVGETVGMVIGTVLSEVANLMRQFMGITQASGLVEGLKKGFDSAGGVKAVKDIISMVFQGILNLVLTVIKTAPVESAIVAGLFMLPSVLAGVITSAVTAVFTGGMPFLMAAFKKMVMGLFRTKPVTVKDLGSAITDPRRMLPAAKGGQAALPGANLAAAATKGNWFSKMLTNLGKFGEAIKVTVKLFGKLQAGFAILDFILGKLSGESTEVAAGGAVGGLAGGIIGGAIGTAIAPGIGTAIGSVLGTLVGDWIGSNLAPFFADLPAKLSSAWLAVETWFRQLPYNLGVAVGRFIVFAQDSFVKLYNWFSNLSTQFAGWVNKTVVDLRLKWNNFIARMSAAFQDGSIWGKLGNALLNGLKWMMDNVIANLNPITWVQKGMQLGQQAAGSFMQGVRAGQVQQRSANPAPTFAPGSPASMFQWRAKGGLGDAIASEIKHKPPGSNLVIANSSETVIPAAGGNSGAGMVAFVDTLRSGFDAMVVTLRQTSQQAQTHLTTQMTALGVTFKTAQEKQRAEIAKISQTLVSNQQQTNAKLSALEKKFNAPMMPGGLGGGAAGGVDAFTPIASQMGLTLTSGYRPGDPGWHGVNRARDYSNGTGPTPQMMQFAQYMASTYGSNLKELIYTPLGFSIKNGQRVAPYAQGAHYNHVHVAYAMGLGNGVAFNSLSGAQAWERSMVSGSVKVGSVTGNSAEGFGGGTTVTNNITINQQPGQDSDELASIVALKIGEAVADARASSIFV